MSILVILDLVVIILLVSTIAYALYLNRRLASIYHSRGELQQFLKNFTASMAKAESSMALLKDSGESAFAKVHEHMKQGSVLKDDLTFLIERGETIANQLDDAVRQSRQQQNSAAIPAHIANIMEPIHEQRFKQAANMPEPDLIQAIKHVR